MAEAYRIIQDVRDLPEAPHVRIAVKDFGSRWRCEGLAKAVAFALVRARFEISERKLSDEAKAYRLFLGWIFPGALAERRAVCIQAIAGAATGPPDLARTWEWLNRYAEFLPRMAE